MGGTRQTTWASHCLALALEGRGEAPVAGHQGAEPFDGEARTRKPGSSRTSHGGGVRSGESRK